MRTLLLLTAIVALFFASCSTGSQVQSSIQGDDLYVARTPATTEVTGVTTQSGAAEGAYQDGQVNPDPDYTTTEKYTDENGNNYITNNYYEGQNYDFYGNDYGYSSSLSHWYGPSLGFSYFSPYYSMGGFGSSIYFGFGWGNSWYNPFYSPFYSYNPWYSPYYYGYNPYYNPFYNPYYGYYGGGGYCGGYYGGGYYGGGYYGDGGYGYGGNTYYGSHGSSSSNTANTVDGRHYKFGDDSNGGNNSGGTDYNNLDLNVTPASLNNLNGNGSNNLTPIKTTGTIERSDIGSNTLFQEHNVSGAGNLNTETGRNPASTGNINQLNAAPPIRNNAPVQGTMQDNRSPRTSNEILFQEQRNANAAINGVNGNYSTVKNGNVKTNSQPSIQQSGSIVTNEMNSQPVRSQKEISLSNSKSNAAESQKKSGWIKYEKPSKSSSQHSDVNINSQRSISNNPGNTGRSYSQPNNSRSAPSGNSRSSGSTPRRQ